MVSIQLHDYQLDLKTRIYRSWGSGHRNVCAVAPTGSGKSIITSDIILEGFNQNRKQAVVAHRNELVLQMSEHIAMREIPHRIIGSSTTVAQAIRKHRARFGKSFINPTAATAVVGVDTLMSRKDALKDWARQIDNWVIDEFHHCVKNNKWGTAVEMFSNAYGLGVTATPNRPDGQGLGREYDGFADDLILGPSMRFLIDHGFLSDFEIVCPLSDLNVDDEPTSKDGDWSNKKLKKAAKKSHIVGDVVGNYFRYALGRRAIVFATDVETAQDIAARFREAGVKCEALSAKSLSAYREHCIEQFKNDELKIIVNVDLFDEGFDCPACDVVIMARPTMSVVKYLQMIGRALRYVPGKTALIIDHVSNVFRHGLPDKERTWTLARREKRGKQIKDPDDIPLTRCPNCLKPYESFRLVCPYCGFEKPLPDPKSRSVEMVEGDLVLLDKVALERMRQATELENPADIGKRVEMAAGPIAGKGAAKRQIEKIAAHRDLSEAIAQWAAIEREKGFSDREIYKKFYLTTGVDVLSALDRSKTRVEYVELAKTVKGWYST